MNRIEIVLTVVVVLLLVMFTTNFVSTSGQMEAHALQIANLTNSFNEYKLEAAIRHEALSKLCNKDEEKLKDFNGRMRSVEEISDRHEQELVRLSNRTTNADVLDELNKVRAHVDDSLHNTVLTLEAEVDAMRTNITEQLTASREEMESISAHVGKVVDKASRHMKSMQDSVALQLFNTSAALNATLETVNSVVRDAKLNIHSQVKDIQSKINAYVAFSNKQFAAENDFVKYQLAGTFTLLACLISLYHITQHQRNYAKPEIQRRIMAIIWMVPVYSMSSWLSMVSGPASERVFETLKQFYEAYVVYTFFGMLIAVLEEGRGLSHLIERITLQVEEEQHAVVHAQRLGKPLPTEHIKPPFPVCYEYDSSVRIAITWLYQCKLLVMQFVLLKPVYSILPFVLTSLGVDYYHIPMSNAASDMEDSTQAYFHQINWESPHLYMLILENLSVSLAFYGLLSFFHGTEKELAWCNPWPKFVCIKAIVFMTFWQGLCINMMSTLGMVDEKAASQIQNLLVCIEMLIASLALIYVFPFQEWQEGFKRDKQIMLKDTLAFRDFMRDVKQMVTRWSTSNVGSPMPGFGPNGSRQRYSVLEQNFSPNMESFNIGNSSSDSDGGSIHRAAGVSVGIDKSGCSSDAPSASSEASPLLNRDIHMYGGDQSNVPSVGGCMEGARKGDIDGDNGGESETAQGLVRLNSALSEFEQLAGEDDYIMPDDGESGYIGFSMTRLNDLGRDTRSHRNRSRSGSGSGVGGRNANSEPVSPLSTFGFDV